MRIGKIIALPFFGSAHLLDFLPNLGGIMHTKKLCHFRYATQLDMSSLVGKTMTVMMPVMIENVQNDNTFTFNIDKLLNTATK